MSDDGEIRLRPLQKRYSVTMDDISRMQRFDPEHLIRSGDLYRYSGGCFFKIVNRLKRRDPVKPKR